MSCAHESVTLQAVPQPNSPELERTLRRGRFVVEMMCIQSLSHVSVDELLKELPATRGREQSCFYSALLNKGRAALPALLRAFAADPADSEVGYVPIDLREEELAALPDDPDEETPYREILVSLLQFIGREAIPEITAFLRDPRHRLRRDAARILGCMGPLAFQATEELRRLTRDEDALVRQAAARALASIHRSDSDWAASRRVT